MMYKIYLPFQRHLENEFSVNNINLKSHIGSIMPSVVDLRHGGHNDAYKKWVKYVDHIFLDRIDTKLDVAERMRAKGIDEQTIKECLLI